MAYQYLTDEQLQGALDEYVRAKQPAEGIEGTKTEDHHGLAKRATLPVTSPAIETRSPAQILVDDIATGGPVVVLYNTTKLIFGTCDLSPMFPAYQIYTSYNFTCPTGIYCPKANVSEPYSVPQICPPTPECYLARLNGGNCQNGKYEPMFCEAGKYCPSHNETYICPAGHFCPLGSSKPLPCGAMAACDEGSARAKIWSGVFAACIIDVALLAAFYLITRRMRRRFQQRRVKREAKDAAAFNEDDPAAVFSAVESKGMISLRDLSATARLDPLQRNTSAAVTDPISSNQREESIEKGPQIGDILGTSTGTPPTGSPSLYASEMGVMSDITGLQLRESPDASIRSASPDFGPQRGRPATSRLASSGDRAATQFPVNGGNGGSPSASLSPLRRSDSRNSIRGLRRLGSANNMRTNDTLGNLMQDPSIAPASTLKRSISNDSFILDPSDLKMSKSMMSLASVDNEELYAASGVQEPSSSLATAGSNASLMDIPMGNPSKANLLQARNPAEVDTRDEDMDSNDIVALLDGLNRGRQGRQLKLDFKFRDLSIVLPDGKTILNEVTGRARAGRVTAIMGPSGSGKTTLMNCLMGKINRTSGDLFINNISATGTSHGQVVAYVPQQDVMLPEMTVKESIQYSAKIRLPRDWTKHEIDTFVEAILGALDLKHVADTLVGDENTRGVSGGQKKRCNIGLELASSPLALFLDEPTSGLDSTSALKVAKILSKLARLGLTIVTVIHQPRYEIFQCLDDLIMMAPGGIVAYSGTQKEVIPYFDRLGFKFGQFQNPADVLLDILSAKGNLDPAADLGLLLPEDERRYRVKKTPNYEIRHVTKAWTVHVEKSGMGREHMSRASMLPNDIARLQEEVKRLTMIRGARWWSQIVLVHNRAAMQQLRRIDSFVLDLGSSAVAGLVIGIITASIGFNELYHGTYIGDALMFSPAPFEMMVPLYALMLSISIALVSASAAARLLSDERLVFKREFNAGHSVFAYFIGKNAIAIYRIALLALHYSAFIQLMTKPYASYGATYACIFGWYFGVWGIGQVVSLLSKKENASLSSILAALLFSVFTGMGPTLNSSLGGVISITYSRWIAEAVFTQEIQPYTDVYLTNISSTIYGYTLGRFSYDIGVAVVIAILLRLLAFGIMWLQKKRDR